MVLFSVFLIGSQVHLNAASVVGTGTAASCTDSAFTKALAGGGLITFNCGTTPVTITLASQKTIAVDTTIDGRGLVTLSGASRTALLYINNFQGVNVTVQNLKFVNALSTQEGAAIHAHYKSNLTVINCTFTSNVTNSTKAQFGGGGGAIFIGSEAKATVTNSVFTNNSGANGGAIYSLNSSLTITSSSFSGNKATLTSSKAGSGGAIWSDTGPITITDSKFSTNNAAKNGGAVAVSPDGVHPAGKFTVNRTSFTGNSAGAATTNGLGGAVFVQQALSLTNSAFSGNTANREGGALWLENSAATLANVTISGNKTISTDGQHGMGAGIMQHKGSLALINVTIANNYSDFLAGGIFGGTSTTVRNTIIARNVAHNGGNNWNIQNNCSATLTNGGNNLQYPGNECGFGTASIKDPLLGALANNGGPTQTQALQAGSPAINAGNTTVCAASPVSNIDQRGVTRNSPCDIGAYETGTATASANPLSAAPTFVPSTPKK